VREEDRGEGRGQVLQNILFEEHVAEYFGADIEGGGLISQVKRAFKGRNVSDL